MSRCFPFPPPGYEKKARFEDTKLLKKENPEEKKHKKDKEKKKREGKEKRDKDRSKEKQREKKDRKEKHKDKDKDRDKEKNRTSDEKKVEGQPSFYNGQKLGSNNLQNNEIKDSFYVQELARRIKDEDKALESQMLHKVVATNQRGGEVQGMVVEGNVGNQPEEKENFNNRNEVHKGINGQKKQFDTRVLGQAFHQNFSGMGQERVEGIVKLVEKKHAEKQTEGKEMGKHKESDGKGDKHKGRDQEKHRKRKDKDRNKEEEEEEEEKVKEITEPNKKLKLKENVPQLEEGSKDPLDFRNHKALETLKLTSTNPATEGNLGKRKELGKNGYLLDNGSRPNKFPKSSSSFSLAENGKKLEQCQTIIQSSEKLGLANNHKVDVKKRKLNGLIAAQQPNICSTKPSSVDILAYENGETPLKPHPDMKYLSQILYIPEMEKWPDDDDQEWLFSSNYSESKKPSSGYPVADGMLQVWADALRIDSADISALPYVIPY